MSRYLYYLLIKPLSFLPLSVLYVISNGLAFIFYNVIPYRQKVIRENLINSFPNKSSEEIEVILKKFIQHLCDLIVESVRVFSIPQKELQERVKVVNPELINDLYDQGKNIVLCMGHYNNWEMVGTAFNAKIKHQMVALYTPLSCPFFERKFKNSRCRTGVKMIPKMEMKSYLEDQQKNKRPFCLGFGTDQSPTYSKKVYWTNFLSQQTAVMFGSEKFAKELDAPVVYGEIKKVKRGYYELRFEILVEEPLKEAHCSITEKHTRRLEKQILEEPAYWLWSHKRWKRKVTKDYPSGVIPKPALQF